MAVLLCVAPSRSDGVWPGHGGVQGSCQRSEEHCLELSLLAETEQTNGKCTSFMLPTAVSQVRSQLHAHGRSLIREGNNNRNPQPGGILLNRWSQEEEKGRSG